jgi:hypothetical protein
MSWFGWPPKDRPIFWVTTAAFLAVCVYAAFTKQQVSESQKANDIADKAFFTVNRPYVMWVQDRPVGVVVPAGAPGWQIFSTFVNYGKTPATNMELQFCDLIIRPNPTQPIFTCTISEAPPRDIGIIGPGQQQLMTGPVITDREIFNDTFNEKRFFIRVWLFDIS